jgi:hypothetical protein
MCSAEEYAHQIQITKIFILISICLQPALRTAPSVEWPLGRSVAVEEYVAELLGLPLPAAAARRQLPGGAR